MGITHFTFDFLIIQRKILIHFQVIVVNGAFILCYLSIQCHDASMCLIPYYLFFLLNQCIEHICCRFFRTHDWWFTRSRHFFTKFWIIKEEFILNSSNSACSIITLDITQKEKNGIYTEVCAKRNVHSKYMIKKLSKSYNETKF